MSDIQFETKNVKHPTKMVKLWKALLVGIMLKFKIIKTQHKIGSSPGDLVLATGISNLKCQTKEFETMNTCHKGIITTSRNIKFVINKKN